MDYGGQYFFTNPRLEIGGERYKWVNQTQLLGQGGWSWDRPSSTRVYRAGND